MNHRQQQLAIFARNGLLTCAITVIADAPSHELSRWAFISAFQHPLDQRFFQFTQQSL